LICTLEAIPGVELPLGSSFLSGELVLATTELELGVFDVELGILGLNPALAAFWAGLLGCGRASASLACDVLIQAGAYGISCVLTGIEALLYLCEL
jgi:hypothetical protein